METSKTKGNVPGPYYVTTDCIACDACVLVSDSHFKINEEQAFAYVHRQPQNQAEEELCQEALSACPVEAIHHSPAK